MLGKFLLPESIARTDGIGPNIDLAADRGKLLVITLGIDRVLEQEALTISILGVFRREQLGCRAVYVVPIQIL
jgi:hypothetical protein